MKHTKLRPQYEIDLLLKIKYKYRGLMRKRIVNLVRYDNVGSENSDKSVANLKSMKFEKSLIFSRISSFLLQSRLRVIKSSNDY